MHFLHSLNLINRSQCAVIVIFNSARVFIRAFLKYSLWVCFPKHLSRILRKHLTHDLGKTSKNNRKRIPTSDNSAWIKKEENALFRTGLGVYAMAKGKYGNVKCEGAFFVFRWSFPGQHTKSTRAMMRKRSRKTRKNYDDIKRMGKRRRCQHFSVNQWCSFRWFYFQSVKS